MPPLDAARAAISARFPPRGAPWLTNTVRHRSAELAESPRDRSRPL